MRLIQVEWQVIDGTTLQTLVMFCFEAHCFGDDFSGLGVKRHDSAVCAKTHQQNIYRHFLILFTLHHK